MHLKIVSKRIVFSQESFSEALSSEESHVPEDTIERNREEQGKLQKKHFQPKCWKDILKGRRVDNSRETIFIVEQGQQICIKLTSTL